MSKSIAFYNARAERYARRKGFAPARKERMLQVTLDLLTALAPPGSTLLEIGAGTGSFTEVLLQAGHFGEIYVTDGAQAMLDIARRTLEPDDTALHFLPLDFTAPWSDRFARVDAGVDAVTSAMAIHHAADKAQLFRQVWTVLEPGGIFAFADHVAGASENTQYLIDRERALVRLGGEKDPERIQEVIETDRQVGRREGNVCEPVARYLDLLTASGFCDVDCLWRDYWLTVFVARKPGSTAER
jgi:ubiquinone/menaquinone biosynthesis C-methylase UbiE